MTAHEFLNKEYFYLIIDSRETNIDSEDIEKAMQEYTKMKCQDLLRIVAEKALIKGNLEAYDILRVVDLDKFID
jgi:hypothetical protein